MQGSKRLLLTIAGLAAATAVHAQIAPVLSGGAGGATTAPPPGISGNVALGYISTAGNTQSTNANATFSLLDNREHWDHELDVAAVAATADEVTTAEAYNAKFESRRALGEGKPYVFTSLNWRQDRFSAYESELSATAGYGRRLIERMHSALNAEIGAGEREAKLRDGPRDNEGIVRGAVGYALTFSEMTGFTEDLVIESGSTNTSIESIAAVHARLVGRIGLVLSLRIKRNSDVPPGIEPTDRFTSISLEYAF